MPCDVCNSFKRLYPIQPIEGASFPPGFRAEHVRNNVPYEEFKYSASSCHSCSVMLEGCHGCLRNHDLGEELIVSLDMTLGYHAIVDEERDIEKVISLNLNDGSTFRIQFFTLTDKDIPDEWDDVPVLERTTKSTDSDQAFEKIQSWLDECFVDHDFCSKSLEAELPTRVVDVGLHGGPIRLVETRGQSGQYACLSHCWGPAQVITTTRATLNDHKISIDPQCLPKTFSDSIQLMRKFKIRYIWIDSLCIIQDDDSDWVKESACMASIYQNACFTIAATLAPSGDAGLFTKTPDHEVSGVTPSGEAFLLVFRRLIDHFFIASGRDSSATHPLLSRGWVFQERLLSPRVVHFGPDEVFFECRTDSACECGGIAGAEVALPQPKLAHANALDSTGGGGGGRYLARVWRAMVMQYSELDLTYASDCLPALGGLARHMAVARRTRYVSGMWEDSLLDDLLWQGAGAKREYKGYIAPSWSWASVNYNIYYEDAPLYWHVDEAEAEAGDFTHYISVDSWECTPESSDEFGRLKDGQLRLSGSAIEGTLHYGPRDANPRPLNWGRNMNSPVYFISLADGKILEIYPDYAFDQEGPGHIPQETRILCLRMSVYADDSKKILFSLILRCVDESSKIYQRIGLLKIRFHQGGAKVAEDAFAIATRTSIVVV